MTSPIRAIRFCIFLCCIGGGYLTFIATHPDRSPESPIRYLVVAALLGLLLILADMALKGFSLRSLTSVTFGIATGTLIAFLLSVSPLLNDGIFTGDGDYRGVLFGIKVAVFIAATYLATVITLRARDEFNLVIPYVRFNPLDTPVQQVVVDASALIDGRVTGLCETGFFTADIVLPRFVIDELHQASTSSDTTRRARGRRGLANLNSLKEIAGEKLRIHESGAAGASGSPEERLVALTHGIKAALLTTDYNIAQIARFRNVRWLNLNALAKAMKYELSAGDVVEVELAREGREPGQAVGYLPDGSMVVVPDGAALIGKNVAAEVVNLTATSAGRMVFAKVRQSV